jgi:hypothetical protein
MINVQKVKINESIMNYLAILEEKGFNIKGENYLLHNNKKRHKLKYNQEKIGL